MTSKIMKHMSKAKQVVLFSAPILSVVGGVALNSVSADTVTAGGFDLTLLKQRLVQQLLN